MTDIGRHWEDTIPRMETGLFVGRLGGVMGTLAKGDGFWLGMGEP